MQAAAGRCVTARAKSVAPPRPRDAVDAESSASKTNSVVATKALAHKLARRVVKRGHNREPCFLAKTFAKYCLSRFSRNRRITGGDAGWTEVWLLRQAGEGGIGVFDAFGGDVFQAAPCVVEKEEMDALALKLMVVVESLRISAI
jgi:hypothetical protein